jgi:hypothetical protein
VSPLPYSVSSAARPVRPADNARETIARGAYNHSPVLCGAWPYGSIQTAAEPSSFGMIQVFVREGGWLALLWWPSRDAGEAHDALPTRKDYSFQALMSFDLRVQHVLIKL